MNIIGVIPSRYASTRFPGKPLAMIDGKSMIQRVWEQASKSAFINEVIVATDDSRIFDHVKGFGGLVMMTSAEHQNGTSRCHEVLEILKVGKPDLKLDALINIQGDEPYINPRQIDQVAELFENPSVELGTLAKVMTDPEEVFSEHVVKVVMDNYHKALYFSRQALPFVRDINKTSWPETHAFYKHIGIYGYRSDTLPRITQLEAGKLEHAEKLEQLRWLENGFPIHIAVTEFESPSVDTPGDLSKLTNKR
jgi:3-deoxy-manno-octulosonate cytidylyltransferase (CMP-KDO synthetase)